MPIRILLPRRGSIEPALCCGGHYCPSPTEIKKCISGIFCKAEKIEPFRCRWTESCPEGTEDPNSLGMFIVLAITVVLLIGASFPKDTRSMLPLFERARDELFDIRASTLVSHIEVVHISREFAFSQLDFLTTTI